LAFLPSGSINTSFPSLKKRSLYDPFGAATGAAGFGASATAGFGGGS
jgi:hypothetical protein